MSEYTTLYEVSSGERFVEGRLMPIYEDDDLLGQESMYSVSEAANGSAEHGMFAGMLSQATPGTDDQHRLESVLC